MQCDYCSKTYKNSRAVNKHRRLVHGAYIRPRASKYECYDCGSSFEKKSALKVHIRQHVSENESNKSTSRIICPLHCTKNFKSYKLLHSHLRADHMMEVEEESQTFSSEEGNRTSLMKFCLISQALT